MTIRIIQQILPVLVFIAGTCTSDQSSGSTRDVEISNPITTRSSLQTENIPYLFEKPDVSFALPDELMEISGLTVLPNGHLGAVQDEDGILYALNRETGAIEGRYSFGDSGDYEGVEAVGDRVFVLLSNGNLIELTDWSQGTPKTETYKTDLKGKNDTEGLAYDADRERLLIACKEEPGNDLKKDKKAVYAFVLSNYELDPEPVYVIDLDELEKQFDGKGNFKPSSLAVHPSTGDLYVLSSVAKALAVLDGDGSLRHVWPLQESLFEQPEGLAFLPDGTLFISSEGTEGPGMLYRFSYQPSAR